VDTGKEGQASYSGEDYKGSSFKNGTTESLVTSCNGKGSEGTSDTLAGSKGPSFLGLRKPHWAKRLEKGTEEKRCGKQPTTKEDG